MAFSLLSDASSLGILSSSHKFWVPAALTWVKSGASLSEAGSCLGRSVLSQLPVLEFHSWPRWGLPDWWSLAAEMYLAGNVLSVAPLDPSRPVLDLSPSKTTPWGSAFTEAAEALGRLSLTDLQLMAGWSRIRVVALPVAGIDPGV